MKEIIDGNKVIAKFIERQTGRKITTLAARMNYHSNWNSLMSVRSQVKKLGVDVAIDNKCTVGSIALGYSDTITQGVSEREIVWQAMVNFTRWYNAEQAKLKEVKIDTPTTLVGKAKEELVKA